MRTVRIGVVGAGALGRVHAKLYKGIPGAELVGVCDTNPETARTVAAEFGTQVFAGPAELAAAVDGLSVAVPTDRHHAVGMPLLALGKHLLVEKPIAQSSAEARELVTEAARRGVVLAVGHVERFNPVVECLDRTPGDARFIEAHRLAPYPPPRPGMRPRGTEVSVVLDLMIHDLDVILHLVRAPVQRVDAVGVAILSPTEDIANARVVFANGCVANVTASRVSQERLRKIRVFKTQAYLSLDYQERKGETVYLKGLQLVREPVPVEDANALERELQDFCACIRTVLETGAAPAPRVSGQQGLQALELAELILKSCRENQIAVPAAAAALAGTPPPATP